MFWDSGFNLGAKVISGGESLLVLLLKINYKRMSCFDPEKDSAAKLAGCISVAYIQFSVL